MKGVNSAMKVPAVINGLSGYGHAISFACVQSVKQTSPTYTPEQSLCVIPAAHSLSELARHRSPLAVSMGVLSDV